MKCLFLSILLTSLLFWAEAAPIRVGVVDSTGQGGGQQTVTQLNDDTYFDFSATLITPNDADTLAELNNYDVVIIGGSGSGNSGWTSAMASTLRTWVEGGGGLLGTGWYIHERNSKAADIKSNLGAIIPGDANVGYSYTSSATLNFTGSHPITQGLSSFAPGANYVEVNTATLPSGSTVLGYTNSTSNKALMVRDSIGAGQGRSAYLGVLYLASVSGYSTTPLKSGSADRLLEQTVAWLADSGVSNVPSLSATNTNFGNVRVGTSATATVTVSNTGNAGSSLTGNIGPASGSEFSPTSGSQSFTLSQNQTANRTYTYTPGTRGADSTTISITSNANNSSLTLTGTGVSPVFHSSVAAGSTIDFGEVGYIGTQTLTIQNITADANLGDLTDMTLLSATITGPDASYFTLEGFTPGMKLSKSQLQNLTIRFMHEYMGSHQYGYIRNATLTFTTDVGAALGVAGATYSFNLQATTIPEPATTSAFFMAGIMLYVMRFRRKIW
ncbi:MAG: choice-of-anchor D domain-containing protein [Candidatus Brocadiae bacterium]|nr:choice-of-anchor D domain-containing protein [Candidatus Brocadiia bacterium]